MLQYFLIEWVRNTRAGRLVTLERNRRWRESFSPFPWHTSRVLTEEYVLSSAKLFETRHLVKG